MEEALKAFGDPSKRILVTTPKGVSKWLLANRPDKSNLASYFSKVPCKDGLEAGYIEESLNTSDIIILSYKPFSRNINDKPIDAFATIKVKGKSLFVDVICGSGKGTLIFCTIVKIAAFMRMKYVSLKALDSAYFIYADKYGFTLDTSDPIYSMYDTDLNFGVHALKNYVKLPAHEKRNTKNLMNVFLNIMDPQKVIRNVGFPMKVKVEKLFNKLQCQKFV